MKEFLMFDKLVLPWIIRVFYLIGQSMIILAGIMKLTDRFYITRMPYAANIIVTLIVMILSSLVLRMFCEAIIVTFKLSEDLSKIRLATEDKGEVYVEEESEDADVGLKM